MPNDTHLHNRKADAPARKALRQRDHLRMPIEADISLARTGAPTVIAARSKDLSWGGAGLLVSRKPLALDESLVLKFPWRQGDSFSVRGEIVWIQQVDHRDHLVGVSFSKLAVCDEEKLQRLLSMLMRVHPGTEQDSSEVETLEIRYLDRVEMLATLEQIRFGCMEATAFKPFETNERIRLHLSGFSDLPTLHLRARVLWQKAFCPEGDSRASGLFRVALALEHPMDDLKRVTEPLIENLSEQESGGSSALIDHSARPESATAFVGSRG